MMFTRLYVPGTPGPQGSKSGFVRGGKVNMVESSKKVKPWRAAVVKAWKAEHGHLGEPAHTGPVIFEAVFYLDRPKGHYRTGKYSHLLKASAPEYPAVKPDLDKLVRATLDGLGTAGAFEDDSRVVDIIIRKRYTGPDVQPLGIPGPGATLCLYSAGEYL